MSPRRDWSRIARLCAILLGHGSGGLALGVIAPLLAPISNALGNEQLSQVIVVTPFLGLAIAGLTTGWIAKRLGVRGTLCAGALLLAAAGAIGFFAPTAPFLIAGCLLLGAAGAVLTVGAGLLLGQLYDGAARARVIGYAMAFGGLIACAAVVLSGVIADKVGWHAAFLQCVAGGALILVFTIGAVRNGAAAPAEASVGSPRISMLAAVAPYFAAVFLLMLLINTNPTHIPLLMRDAGVRSNTATSMVLSAQALFSMLGSLAYASLQSRLGRLPAATIGVALLALGGVIIASADSAAWFGFACAVLGTGNGLLLPYLTEGLYLRAPLVERGYALGIFSTLLCAGGFVSPFVMRPIRAVTGLHGLYGVLAAATALIGAVFILRAISGRAAPLGAAHGVASDH